MTEINWASFEAVAKKMKLGKKETQTLKKRFDRWKRAVEPVAEEIRRSEAVGEEDLAIRINVRDDD